MHMGRNRFHAAGISPEMAYCGIKRLLAMQRLFVDSK